jgi:hypothetical protein
MLTLSGRDPLRLLSSSRSGSGRAARDTALASRDFWHSRLAEEKAETI